MGSSARGTGGRGADARLELALALGLALVFACVALAAWLLGSTRLRLVPAALLGLALAQGIALVLALRRRTARLTRALAAWRAGELPDEEPARDELDAELRAVTRRLRDDRGRAEERRAALEAIVGHAPSPLLVLDGRRVELANQAARRLFGAAIATVDDLAAFGDALARDALAIPPGERRLGRITVDGVPRRVLIGAGAVRLGSGERRLLAIESIETELEARTLEAWIDMARVLAHEIMSSLTPVASLTATAAQVLGEIEAEAAGAAGAPGAPGARDTRIAEAREATATAARRADGLMDFVRRYRELAALPAPALAPIDLVEVVQGVAALLGGALRAAGTELSVEALPARLPMRGDRALLEQALINLVRNADDAVRGRPGARVWLTARVAARGGSVVEVADNGPGVPPELADKIFVPFFTTKRGGSGIGLTVAQHVAHAHGGALRVTERAGGGAVFALWL